MYEIWLTLNILWELALGAWPVVLGLALLWLVLVVVALVRRARWRPALLPALGLGAAVAVVAFLAVPAMTKSSLSEMGYWVDWANLLAIALAAGGVAATVVWPVLGMRKRRPA